LRVREDGLGKQAHCYVFFVRSLNKYLTKGQPEAGVFGDDAEDGCIKELAIPAPVLYSPPSQFRGDFLQ
jgi:hypothetical protein